MNRLVFTSGEKIDRLSKPSPGQRWVSNKSDEWIQDSLLKMAPERRASMSKFWETQRKSGFVIVERLPGGWNTHRNPKNPHPLHKYRLIKDEWMEQYSFLEYDKGLP